MSERETHRSKRHDGSARVQPPAAGEVAPGFELYDSLGQLHRLDELTGGRPQVLLFYRGHW
jgi:peroxiredoxin